MITVGQKLFYMPNRGYGRKVIGYEVEVTKVGRKWAYIGDRFRFDIESMEVDGGQYVSPGNLYLSEADCIAADELDKDWSDLRESLARLGCRHKDITHNDMAIVRSALQLPTKTSPDSHL